MNARVVVTITAKVYLGPDIDPTGTTAPSVNRYPDTTQQVTLTEVFDAKDAGSVQVSAWGLGTRCARAIGDAVRGPAEKAFK